MAAFASQLSAAQRQYESESPDEPADGLIERGEANEFIRENCADAFLDMSLGIVEEWIAGPQDRFAEAKLLREVKTLADRYVQWCETEDMRRIAESWGDAEEAMS